MVGKTYTSLSYAYLYLPNLTLPILTLPNLYWVDKKTSEALKNIDFAGIRS